MLPVHGTEAQGNAGATVRWFLRECLGRYSTVKWMRGFLRWLLTVLGMGRYLQLYGMSAC